MYIYVFFLGKLMMFQSEIPSFKCPGQLDPRKNDRRLIGTDKEKVC